MRGEAYTDAKTAFVAAVVARARAMRVETAGPDDVADFLALAAEVEDWFGPMIGVSGFHEALDRSIARGTALCVRRPDGQGLRGGVFYGTRTGACRIGWLVVAGPERGRGVGAALVGEVVRRLDRPATIEVVTFAAGHPAAGPSGARSFYERLGFDACEPADAGPDGTPRQWFRLRPA